jgi:putative ABC transport system permease protein
VRDWQAFVRSHLALPELLPERESRIVRELAAQLEDFYREALARGRSEAAADAFARAQITDWKRMARDLQTADRRHARPPLDRLADQLPHYQASRPGVWQVFANVLTDLRYGLRQLRKAPGFTAIAVLTLGLGIGATSAIFSVLNGVMLRPLTYPEPERLMWVFEVLPKLGRFSVAPANFLDWRQQTQVFERIAAFTGGNETLIGSEGPERIPMTSVSWNIFETVGVRPVLGRTFQQSEDLPKQNNVIILSHGMWQRRFGGDPNVVGRSVTLSGTPMTIVGVMPEGFSFPSRESEFWRPIGLDPVKSTRGGHFLAVIGRLRPGASHAQADAEMQTIAQRLAQQYPQNSDGESAEVINLQELVVGPVRPMLWTLMAAVGVVVLIACANVANLLLVRASVREREIAIRTALGAGRQRLVVQMLTESLVLALAGGALGILFAWLSIGPIQELGVGSIPRLLDITVDRTVLGFAILVSVLTGILFGLAPAWQASRGGIGTVLKEGGRSSSSARGHWVRSTLLVAEVALSLVLLVGAALLLRSFAKVTTMDPGFEAEHVLAFRVALPQTAYPERHNRIALFDRLLARLQQAPGVMSAGMTQTLPMRGDYMLSVIIQGRPPAKPADTPSANYRSVSPGYFQTLGIPLLAGRLLNERDTESSPMVAIVDQAFARRHFPDENPIGKGIDIGNGTDGFYEVVGVVGDVRHDSLDRTPSPTMYAPFRTDVFGSMWLLVRTSGDPQGYAGMVRQTLREIDGSLPAFSILPLSEVVSDTVAQRRFSMLLLSLFAFLALFLAAVGLYGVVGYSVSQRTQEIGVRIAIGAQPGQVLRLVIGGGLKLALIGVVLGIGVALALASYVATLLFEVTPFDPVSYSMTAALLLAVSALASYVPARRAMSVDPLTALRQE